MDAYDNWKTSPPEPKKIGQCGHCLDDIQEGDTFYTIDSEDEIVHDQCFHDYAMAQLSAQKVN